MNLFDWLLIGHFVGDYLFQTGWMATNKMKRIDALVVHSAVYTATVFLFSLFSVKLSVAAVLAIFFSHIAIDQGSFVRWWTTFVQHPPSSERKWLTIMADQSFHLIILVIAISLVHP